MMRPSASSFPTVNTSWILVAQRTLEQFTHVRNTEEMQRNHRGTLEKFTMAWCLTSCWVYSHFLLGVV